ncbi:MAG: hypothetical protein A2096_10655 [Spirochaetes bacterium GWF1_41_5]|nr:MAG: hypothetical protein A2096_10655 [Spirochaetes bacterium GWF1_41_5]HBE03725.1 hypothetical protein [Spirochaetia bacterium]
MKSNKLIRIFLQAAAGALLFFYLVIVVTAGMHFVPGISLQTNIRFSWPNLAIFSGSLLVFSLVCVLITMLAEKSFNHKLKFFSVYALFSSLGIAVCFPALFSVMHAALPFILKITVLLSLLSLLVYMSAVLGIFFFRLAVRHPFFYSKIDSYASIEGHYGILDLLDFIIRAKDIINQSSRFGLHTSLLGIYFPDLLENSLPPADEQLIKKQLYFLLSDHQRRYEPWCVIPGDGIFIHTSQVRSSEEMKQCADRFRELLRNSEFLIAGMPVKLSFHLAAVMLNSASMAGEECMSGEIISRAVEKIEKHLKNTDEEFFIITHD